MDIQELQSYSRSAIVLIGSGPANLVLAEYLTDNGLSTLVIEAGEDEYSADSQDSYQGESKGSYHLPYGLKDSRMRFLGGSSNCWAGGCGEFSDFDFEARDWVPLSGWPIAKHQLEPFYAKAYEYFHLEAPEDSESSINGFTQRRLAFSSVLRLKGAKLKGLLSRKNFKLLTGFTLIDLNLTDHSVSSAVLVDPSGKRLSIQPRILVLGCGGIENARLLLNFAETRPDAFGPAVGKFFCEHPIAPVATIVPADSAAEKFFENLDASGIDYQSTVRTRSFFEVPFSEQLTHKLSNIALQVIRDQEGLTDAQRAAVELRSLIKNGTLEDFSYDSFTRMVSSPLEVVDAFLDRLIGSDTRLSLRFQLEQTPFRESYLTLGREKDAFGLRRSELRWQISDLERKSVDHAVAMFAEKIQDLGLGTLLLDPFFRESSAGLPPDLRGGQHHCGTTRMGHDFETSVVDSNCRAHKFKNLYLHGSSVFPTNGWMNPTLTIVALAYRLGAHIHDCLSVKC